MSDGDIVLGVYHNRRPNDDEIQKMALQDRVGSPSKKKNRFTISTNEVLGQLSHRQRSGRASLKIYGYMLPSPYFLISFYVINDGPHRRDRYLSGRCKSILLSKPSFHVKDTFGDKICSMSIPPVEWLDVRASAS
jgi:hypothetical protein